MCVCVCVCVVRLGGRSTLFVLFMYGLPSANYHSLWTNTHLTCMCVSQCHDVISLCSLNTHVYMHLGLFTEIQGNLCRIQVITCAEASLSFNGYVWIVLWFVTLIRLY